VCCTSLRACASSRWATSCPELSVLENESRELTRENDRLKLELATLKSPTRLERLAREKLRMAPPPATSIVLIEQPALGRASQVAARSTNATPRVAQVVKGDISQ
jgi:cell division protein FtsL